MLVVFIFKNLIEILEEKRYLENTDLSKKQEKQLLRIPGIIIEDYGNGFRCYRLAYDYK